ncbi:S1/P1 nuclease, partial [Roseateles sp.]|uniref:S1/P1 nuclease n=1 Tax=Roseateles sp. TaxID=1971397 RepID=UPI00286BEC85
MQPLPAFITRVAALLAALLAARQAARLAALLAISLWLTPALAWGPYGHQAVGAIADQLIAGTPTAAKVRAVLGSNLQMASVWADCARSVESVQGVWSYTNPGAYKDCAVYENAASQAALIAFVKRNASRCAPNASHEQCRHKAYHFTNISIQRAGYDAALPGAGPSNVVLALGAAITVLQGGKSPPPINFVGQREALRLLTHYVGDLHQPLHVGSV